MDRRSEKVKEFREIVDGAIDQHAMQVEGGSRRPISITPSYNKEAKIIGLTFASIDQHDARLSAFGFSEAHMWGVSSGRRRLLGRTAFLSIMSTEDRHDTLTRRWSLDSSMQMIDVSTQAELTEVGQMSDVIEWIKSPHLAMDAFMRIGRINEQEKELVLGELHDVDVTHRQVGADLQELADNRRASAEDAHDL